MSIPSSHPGLSPGARVAVLLAAFGGLVFDGVELGLMPVASRSISISLLGDAFTEKLAGQWFAWFTAALMLGAAIGGILLGNLGDRVGRTRAMGISILFYTLFAGLGAWVETQQQMLALRFLVGLGVGGMWPNGVALVSECWPKASRPMVSGILGAGMNVGVLTVSQVTRIWHISPDSWRWIFVLAAVPAVLGILVLLALPESPRWLAARGRAQAPSVPLSELFQGSLLRRTLVGIVLSSIPLIGAWAGSKWMIPWADKIGGTSQADYKSITQGWWALGATLGSLCGAQIASWLGRRTAYFLISLGATVLTISMFQLTAPLQPTFLPIVFVQGFVATLFFGWLPLYLPELFPTRVRATGTGLSMNAGRFATAAGVVIAASVFTIGAGEYPAVGTAMALVYALGMVAVWWAPDTSDDTLDE